MPKNKARKSKNPALVLLAKIVRQRRYELGFTQEELAEHANMHVNYIGGIERATRNPSLECLIKLAQALKISPNAFFPD